MIALHDDGMELKVRLPLPHGGTVRVYRAGGAHRRSEVAPLGFSSAPPGAGPKSRRGVGFGRRPFRLPPSLDRR